MSSRAHRAGSRRRPAAPRRARTKRASAESERFGWRLAPRRKTRGRSSSRVDWDRFGRIALVLMLFVVLLLYFKPVSNFVHAWKDKSAEQQRLADVRAERETLTQQAGVLKDPNAAETAARKNGMVASGERPYVIRGIDP